jgi:hypothetical protein
MFKLNKTEKLAFAMRYKGSVNGEKSKKGKVYKVMYCGQAIYQSEYFSFCQAEINRLVAADHQSRKNLKIV